VIVEYTKEPEQARRMATSVDFKLLNCRPLKMRHEQGACSSASAGVLFSTSSEPDKRDEVDGHFQRPARSM
jgi:hypothetical protein